MLSNAIFYILPSNIVNFGIRCQYPLRTEFPVFWEFLGILKNSQLCKWPLQTEFPVSWEFLGKGMLYKTYQEIYIHVYVNIT